MQPGIYPILFRGKPAAPPAGATLVQTTGEKGFAATNNATDTILTTANFTAGNTAILAITYFNDGTAAAAGITSISIGGTGATKAVGQQHTDNVSYRSEIWYASSLAGGSNAITITWASGAGPNHYVSCSCEEWSGVLASPLDQTAAQQSTGTTITATTASTAQANELVYCCGGPTNSNAAGINGPSSGYTPTYLDNGGTFLAGAGGYKKVSATGVQSGSIGQTASAEGDVVVATFKTN